MIPVPAGEKNLGRPGWEALRITEEESDLWRESVRRYNARRRAENRLAWCQYFGRIAAALRSRAEEYDHRAQALQEDRGRVGVSGPVSRHYAEWGAV